AQPRVALLTTCLDTTRLREVPGEKAGVHLNSRDPPRRAEPYDCPVIPGFASASCFPAIDNFTTIPEAAALIGAGPGLSRLSLPPKDSSLAARTLPPSQREARSITDVSCPPTLGVSGTPSQSGEPNVAVTRRPLRRGS